MRGAGDMRSGGESTRSSGSGPRRSGMSIIGRRVSAVLGRRISIRRLGNERACPAVPMEGGDSIRGGAPGGDGSSAPARKFRTSAVEGLVKKTYIIKKELPFSLKETGILLATCGI